MERIFCGLCKMYHRKELFDIECAMVSSLSRHIKEGDGD